ncbi:MAG: AMP-binding protein [Pseudomonadota bacterium]
MHNTFFWSDLERFDSATCLSDGAHEVTYRELAQYSDNLTSSLPASKSLVLLHIDNSREAIAAYLGLLRRGHAVMLCEKGNTTLAATLRSTYLPEYECRLDTDNPEFVPTGLTGESLHPDLAMIISTSGSSGTAKAVRLSYENLDSNAGSIASYLELSPADRALLTLPLHYCYGLSVVNSHLATGASIVPGRVDITASEFFDHLRSSRATSFAGVPYTFDILERRKFRDQTFDNLRYITQAGGKLSVDLVREYGHWAKDQGKAFFVMYGQTEATARISYVPREETVTAAGTIGRAVPGGRISLCRDDGQPVAPSEEGEITYEGPNVMLGYGERRSDLQLGRTIDRLATGDIAVQEPNGFFRIVGRKSRFSKIFGIRLNLDAVEAHLASNGIRAKAVSDDRKLILVSDDQALDNDTAAAIADQFNLPLANIVMRHIDAYPLLSSDKIDYRTLLTWATEQEYCPSSPKTQVASEEIVTPSREAKLVALFREFFPSAEIDGESSFASLDGDSMSFVGVSLGIEEALGMLPQGWEDTPIKELAQTQERKSGFLATIETSIYLRAIAPIAVVLNHSGLEVVRGGAAALLLLAGYNFYRFQWKQFLDGKFFQAWTAIIVNVLIPYWLILVSLQFLKGEIEWQNVLLIGNVTHFGWADKGFGVWFIQVFVQSMVLVSVPLLFDPIRAWVKRNELGYFVLIAWIAILVRFLMEPFLLGEYVLSQKGQHLFWASWLFAGGAFLASWRALSIGTSDGDQTIYSWHSLLVVLMAIILTRTFYVDDMSRTVFVSIAIVGLVLVPRLPCPRMAIPVLSTTAAASYFIYMLHQRGRIVEWSEALPIDIVRVGSGVLIGIIGWKIYTLGEGLVRKAWANILLRVEGLRRSAASN